MTATESSQWVEIGVDVDHEAVEPVVEIFSQFGYQGGVAIQQPILQDRDGDNLRVDTERTFRVTTYLPVERFDEDVRATLERRLWHLNQLRPVGPLSVAIQRESDWEEAWKAHFEPVRVSDRIVVQPPWREYEPESDDLVVVLDPGMAFGTGTHPTTRLSLKFLESVPLADASMLDVGAGTGILSIAARMLGARSVDAVEVDSVAVKQAQSNVDLNAMSADIHVEHGDGSSSFPNEPYDFVVANIISRILVDLRASLSRAVAPGGLLILSGIIESKEQGVVDSFLEEGLEMVERRQEGDWVAFLWKKPELELNT